ncbi:MAG: type II toxin-antitoxin system PemK/MazF family toxin [Lachnospiraceae bacterium]|nr:type II toxin-antitoxin system PemK/MazF family toxin [Lachnospiraceae bacterium]
MELKRGEIYYLTFPYTLDPKYPDGKPKFVLVLQEGEYFSKYNTVEIMLITSDKQYKPREKYATDVEIEVGTTKLKEKSWVLCSQPYPIEKKLFEREGVWCAGKLSPEKMDEIDEATYIGLCMGLQHDLAMEPADEELVG